MTKPSKPPDETSRATVALSGFPLQTAVARIVQDAPRWRLVAEEAPWNDDGKAEFVDVIARKDALTLVIECKKRKEGVFTFLEPTGTPTTVTDVYHAGIGFSKDSFSKPQFSPWRSKFLPASPSARFCVTNSDPSQRLLEVDAGLAARAADDRANTIELRQIGFQERGQREAIVAVVVTTSVLFRAVYDPSGIPLDTGELEKLALHEETPWVRFTKAFSVPTNRWPHMPERTVFVVSAPNLGDFLARITWEE